MSYTIDPPRKVHTVRRNGLPIGDVFPNEDGYMFKPFYRGQLDNQQFASIEELGDTLEPYLERDYEKHFKP